MKNLFRLDALIVTVQIFFTVWLFTFIPVNWGFLDPVGRALRDFDIYDIVFSQLRDDPPFDDKIVLVNIGNLSRAGIALQISNLNRFNPRIIGIDAFFLQEKDAHGDSLLEQSLAGCPGLVMVSKLEGYDEKNDRYRSQGHSLGRFGRHAYTGYANMPEDEKGSFRTIRIFRPRALYMQDTVISFAVRIAQLYNSTSAARFLERTNDAEVINYRGNTSKFYALDAAQVLDASADLSFIKDKIVLMGYMGNSFAESSMDDIFFTPLNERYAGRTFPDMYGIVIHANIVSMILNGTYIDQMAEYISLIIAWLLTYMNALVLIVIKKNLKDWFGGLTKLILTSQALANLLLGLYIFNSFSYKINLTLALVAVFLVPTSIDIYQNYIDKIFRLFLTHYPSMKRRWLRLKKKLSGWWLPAYRKTLQPDDKKTAGKKNAAGKKTV